MNHDSLDNSCERKQGKDRSETSRRLFESAYSPPPDLHKRIDETGRNLYNAACQRWGKENVDKIHLSTTDPGEASALYLLGPNVCAHLTREQARSLGQRFLTLFAAPMFGAASEAGKYLSQKPGQLAQQLTNDSLGGSAIEMVGRHHPALEAAAGALAGGTFLVEQLSNPNNRKRNGKIAELILDGHSVDNTKLVENLNTSAKTLGVIGFQLASATAAGAVGFKVSRHLASDESLKAIEHGVTNGLREIPSLAADALANPAETFDILRARHQYFRLKTNEEIRTTRVNENSSVEAGEPISEKDVLKRVRQERPSDEFKAEIKEATKILPDFLKGFRDQHGIKLHAIGWIAKVFPREEDNVEGAYLNRRIFLPENVIRSRRQEKVRDLQWVLTHEIGHAVNDLSQVRDKGGNYDDIRYRASEQECFTTPFEKEFKQLSPELKKYFNLYCLPEVRCRDEVFSELLCTFIGLKRQDPNTRNLARYLPESFEALSQLLPKEWRGNDDRIN
jgi:hypothetical protein